MRTIGCPEAQQAEDVEDNHEQDAEQDRNQHDGCRETFHIANVTPPGRAPIRPVPYFRRGNGTSLFAAGSPMFSRWPPSGFGVVIGEC
jgi:hypothetical protein